MTTSLTTNNPARGPRLATHTDLCYTKASINLRKERKAAGVNDQPTIYDKMYKGKEPF